MINFSDPYNPETYFHRVGRTARFGNYGVSFLLMNFQNRVEFFNQKGYKFNVKEYDEKFLEEVNAKLLKKREARNKGKMVEEKNIYDIGFEGILPGWIDANIEVYDNSKFNFVEENKEKNEEKDFVNDKERDLEFESEMLNWKFKE